VENLFIRAKINPVGGRHVNAILEPTEYPEFLVDRSPPVEYHYSLDTRTNTYIIIYDSKIINSGEVRRNDCRCGRLTNADDVL
jgi:hypothetical protein